MLYIMEQSLREENCTMDDYRSPEGISDYMERGFQKFRRRRISVCICNPVQPSVLYETG